MHSNLCSSAWFQNESFRSSCGTPKPTNSPSQVLNSLLYISWVGRWHQMTFPWKDDFYCLVVWNMFSHILGVSSSQLTNSYCSEGWGSTTNQFKMDEPIASGEFGRMSGSDSCQPFTAPCGKERAKMQRVGRSLKIPGVGGRNHGKSMEEKHLNHLCQLSYLW